MKCLLKWRCNFVNSPFIKQCWKQPKLRNYRNFSYEITWPHIAESSERDEAPEFPTVITVDLNTQIEF
jgi:hypothetical protein